MVGGWEFVVSCWLLVVGGWGLVVVVGALHTKGGLTHSVGQTKEPTLKFPLKRLGFGGLWFG